MAGCGSRNPSYMSLFRNGELERRVAFARQMLHRCALCPWKCGVNRISGETGYCRSGARARVADFGPHFGEERPLVARRGSGTIFFAGCNLRCVYCQNDDISHGDAGREVSDDELADMMLDLQMQGCHNINLVSPSHVVAQILSALLLAIERGLAIPLVYNTGGYDSLETLQLLDGIVDIYLPDIKYADERVAGELSGASDYVARAKEALREMHRQVGELEVDRVGAAARGLMIRHLVLPDGLAGTRQVLSFVARELSVDTYVNIMGQYRPCFEADRHNSLGRRPTGEEMEEAYAIAKEVGLRTA